MAISATAVSSSMNTSMLASTRSAKARASAGPPCSSRPANIGTKAALNAPSANSRRNRFGSRCATNHASATALVPNQCAISISRTNPSTRRDQGHESDTEDGADGEHRIRIEIGCRGIAGFDDRSPPDASASRPGDRASSARGLRRGKRAKMSGIEARRHPPRSAAWGRRNHCAARAACASPSRSTSSSAPRIAFSLGSASIFRPKRSLT